MPLNEGKPVCGAKGKRSGQPCQNPAMENGRCRLHGGKSKGAGPPPGSKNATTHGFYTKGLRPDEKPLWEAIELGSIDDEIRLAKLQLRRITEAQRQAEEHPSQAFETVETSEKLETVVATQGDGKAAVVVPAKRVKETKRGRPDYRALVSRFTRLIADLEQRRQVLINGGEKQIQEVRFVIEG